MPPDQIILIYLGAWFVLALSGMLVFRFKKDVAFKKKWFPTWMVLIAVLFWFPLAALSMRPPVTPRSFAFLIGATVVLTMFAYVNIKATRFCDHCRATLFNRNWLKANDVCPKCGAKL